MNRTIRACLLFFFILCSCGKQVQTGRDTIDLVKSISSTPDSPEKVLLSSLSRPSPAGDVYIIGSPQSCRIISDSFLQCDMRENARGRNWRDGLKDFAGETFDCICDSSYTPYADYVSRCGEDAVRELAVRLSLSALSSNCSVSIYDLDGNCEKTQAKMIILADPVMLEFGKFDVDTLFSLTSCGIPVVSPLELALDEVLGSDKKHFNVGLMCESLYVGKGLYPALFDAKTNQFDIVGARCWESSVDASGKALAQFLDAYVLAGGVEPLDALIVDDWHLDLEDIYAELSAIRDFSREESMRYGKLLSQSFSVFSSSAATMRACYDLLRDNNLFTHKIAQPAVRTFIVSPRQDAEGIQYLVIPSENVQN